MSFQFNSKVHITHWQRYSASTQERRGICTVTRGSITPMPAVLSRSSCRNIRKWFLAHPDPESLRRQLPLRDGLEPQCLWNLNLYCECPMEMLLSRLGNGYLPRRRVIPRERPAFLVETWKRSWITPSFRPWGPPWDWIIWPVRREIGTCLSPPHLRFCQRA